MCSDKIKVGYLLRVSAGQQHGGQARTFLSKGTSKSTPDLLLLDPPEDLLEALVGEAAGAAFSGAAPARARALMITTAAPPAAR